MGRGVLDPSRGSFNKWEMYRLLSDEDIGPCRLPATFPWHPETLPRHLQQFHKLYLKPLDAWGGHGVSMLETTASGIRWTRDSRTHTFTRLPELCGALVQVYPPGAAIVQQAAPLCLIDGRVFDVRVLMQRSITEQWVLGGMLARVGGEHSVVSNVQSSGGSVLTVDKALLRALPKTHQMPSARKQVCLALRQSSRSICRMIDPYRHFTEVGLDFGVDGDGQLWSIEVNTDDAIGAPSHDLFAQLPNQRVYQQIEQRKQAYRQSTIQMLFDVLRQE